MVAKKHRGRGIGRALVSDALNWAREFGYAGIQFNAVAASNAVAITLYRSMGFDIVGVIPGGFLHPSKGYVDLYVMYKCVASE